MCVGVMRPAHECCAPNNQTPRMLRDNFFTAQSVLSRDDRTLIEVFTCSSDGFFYLRRLGCDNAKVEIG